MNTNTLNTGFTVTNTIFDTTIIQNPYYETSSVRDSFIEQLKNNIIILEDSVSDEKQAQSVEINSV